MNNRTLQMIRSLVLKTGLDFVTLGTRIGASEKSIYKWMNGTSKPSCDHLLSLFRLVANDQKQRLD